MSNMDEEEINRILEYAANTEVLAVDTEGYKEMENKLLAESVTVGVSIAGNGFEAYFPYNHIVGENLPGEILSKVTNVINQHPTLVFHNAKHDIIALEKLGIKVNKFYDTMLMAHWIDENIPNKKLDYLSVMYGGEPKKRPPIMQQLIDTLGWAYIHTDIMRSYAANDARITWDLFYELYPEFKAQGFDGELWDVEQKFSRVLGKMELRGVKIDKELCEREYDRGISIMSNIEKEVGFIPSHTEDLKKFLLEEMGFPVVKKTKKGNPSFDKEAMQIYDELLQYNNDPRAQLVTKYRGWQKTCSSNYKSYLDLISPDDRVRCNYKMHGTITGRLSCENPNLQQIPRSSINEWNGNLKSAFIAEDGYRLYEADYSQLEFRLAAGYANEKRLLEVFADEKRDIFKEIATELGMKRQDVKTLTYTIAYGGGIQRISTVFGVSNQIAKGIINRYYKAYPRLRKIAERAANKAVNQEYLTLWTGRRRHFKDPSREGHKAFNSIIQGGAAEIVKRKIIKLDEEGFNNDDCRLLLQVHDSVVPEIKIGKEKEYLPEIKRVMEDTEANFRVKFRVDVHEWGK